MAVTLPRGTDVHEKARYDVGGVLLERPFKIRRLGHFGFNVTRVDEAVHFYTDLLGLMISDELDFGGRLPPEMQDKVGPTRGYFTRHGTDHHSYVLVPRGRLERMGMGGGQVTSNLITWLVASRRGVGKAVDYRAVREVGVGCVGRDTP